MAVTLLNTFIKSTIDGLATTLTVGTTNAAGDICVAFWAHPRGALTGNLRSSAGTAYTQLATVASTANLNVMVGYRVFTSSETTVTSCATGSAQDGLVLMAAVLRGAGSLPLIIQQNSTTAGSSNPNSPAVMVPWANSAVLTAGAMETTSVITTAPSGFANLVSTSANDTRDVSAALAFKSTNAGVTDPSSFTGGIAAAWVAFTVTIGSTEAPIMANMGTQEVPPAYRIEPGLSAAWQQYFSGITVPAATSPDVFAPSVNEWWVSRKPQGMIGY